MTPDISYLIAAYDAQDTVPTAIRSALAQEGVDVEVVVVDDASRDGTVAAARAVADDRVRVLTSEVNAGAGAARNRALDAARGTWVAVLDADDTLAPGRSRSLLDLAVEHGADVVVDDAEICDENGATGRTMFAGGSFDRPTELGLDTFIAGNVMLDRSLPYALGYLKPAIRRDVVQRTRARYPEDLRIGEDFYFLCAVLAGATRCITDPNPGYRYLMRSDSISSSLALADVRRLRTADDGLRRDIRLTDSAAHALSRRTASLDVAIDYLGFRDAVRARDLAEAAAILRRRPQVVAHLGIPLRAKAAKLLGVSRDRRL